MFRGHYRTDNSGLNLNRFFVKPSPAEHPSIYAVKEIFLHLSNSNRLLSYIDLHAHATRKGCFAFGNCLDFRN